MTGVRFVKETSCFEITGEVEVFFTDPTIYELMKEEANMNIVQIIFPISLLKHSQPMACLCDRLVRTVYSNICVRDFIHDLRLEMTTQMWESLVEEFSSELISANVDYQWLLSPESISHEDFLISSNDAAFKVTIPGGKLFWYYGMDSKYLRGVVHDRTSIGKIYNFDDDQIVYFSHTEFDHFKDCVYVDLYEKGVNLDFINNAEELPPKKKEDIMETENGIYKPPFKNGSSIPGPANAGNKSDVSDKSASLYKFIVPAELIHKQCEIQDHMRSMLSRYFKLCLGRSRWSDDITLICTADQYLNFSMAARECVYQHPGFSSAWIDKVTNYSPDEPASSTSIHEVFEYVSGRWKNPGPNVEFVQLTIKRQWAKDIATRTLIEKAFDIEIEKYSECTVIARTSQFAKLTTSLAGAGYSINDTFPQMVNAKEYCDHRERERREALMVFDVSSDNQSEIEAQFND